MVSPLLLVVFHLMHLAKLVSYGTGRCISSLSINLPSRLCISCSVPYGENMAFPYQQFCSPLYDWKAMEADDFSWWIKRIKRALDLYDEFRIDHFRGLAGFWAVPSGKLNTSGHYLPAY